MAKYTYVPTYYHFLYQHRKQGMNSSTGCIGLALVANNQIIASES